MTVFWAQADIGPDGKGKLSLGSDYNRSRLSEFLKKNRGVRLKIEPQTPESRKQRGFFEGGIVPFVAYFQENIDYLDADDLHKVRDLLKIEFNGKWITVGDKKAKVPGSTKNELNRGFLERVLDWAGDQGYPIELLNPNEYKKWYNEIRPDGGPEDYITYLVSTGKLPLRK